MFRSGPYAFLLDSALPSERLGRYSFLGGDPFLVFRAKRRRSLEVGHMADWEILDRHNADGTSRAEPIVRTGEGDPFVELRQLLSAWSVAQEDSASGRLSSAFLPFQSGAVGYLGYEAGHLIEQFQDTGADDLEMPDIFFMLCDQVLGHCHATNRSTLSVVGRGDTEDEARRNAERRQDRIRTQIEALEEESPTDRLAWPDMTSDPIALTDVDVQAHFDEATYCEAVDEIKRHIGAGDIYQACMTHRFESPLEGGDAWDLYGMLRAINPAPFASYLQLPEGTIVSASPERFLSVDAKRVVESRPIKGTRPRGATAKEDATLRDALQRSEKDLAENVMIVDLVRNDLGRVCKFGSVQVPEQTLVEAYATVFQMVSTIRGELADGVDCIDLIQACFPGGSMTGAPKIEAMKIIDRLEPVSRGVYSGAIGYLDFSGTVDLNIVIRSAVVKGGRCYYNVGGAVVADSDARAEYIETLDKAKAMQQALAKLRSRVVRKTS